MPDSFTGNVGSLIAPATGAEAVSKSDTVNLPLGVSRALYVGTGGDISVIMDGGQTVTFANVPDGTILPIRVSRVRSTGTDASDIVSIR